MSKLKHSPGESKPLVSNPQAPSPLVAPGTPSSGGTDITKWIAMAEPHLVWTTDNHVSIDSPGPRLDEAWIPLVESCIERFNALSNDQRASRPRVPDLMNSSPGANFVTSSGCVPHILQTFYWWGYTNHFDHCACQELQVATTEEGGGVATIAALIGAFNPVIGAAVGALAGYLAVEAAQISAYDAECDSGGVYQSMSWAAPGVFWIKRVC